MIFHSSGDHIVPNFEEIWPSEKNRDDKYKRRLIGMEYYMDVSLHNVSCLLTLNYFLFAFRRWRTMG